MILYHGSNTGNIKVLKPNQADHDRPYVYMTTMDVVAAFYLCNAVERPYYWFPYGFEGDSDIPVYHELYPNALREVSEGVSGYIYEVLAEENQVIPFKNIPCARLATEPVEVTKFIWVENAYALFMEYVKQGKMKVGHFEDKSEKQLDWWYSCCIEYLKEKHMIETLDCSYASFIKSKLPGVWERYIAECNLRREQSMETKDLILRNWQDSDAKALYEMCLDETLRKSGIDFYNSITDSRNTIQCWKNDKGFKVIADKRNDNFIGFISLGDMNRYDGYMEIEYAVAARYRNNGYAMQAVQRMLDYGFKEMNLSAIAAWVRSHNKESIKVLEKCSFTYEGRLRKHARDKSDTLCYSVLREEWERINRLCIDIRIMDYDDIPLICRADGDESQKNIDYLKRQLDNQKKRECTALLALYNGAVAGYVFLYYKCRWGGLAGHNIPGIVDLFVFEKYRRKKIAAMLLDTAENIARQHCNKIYLDVCLNSDYGSAQRFYIKRGYIPDGKGVYYKEKICEADVACRNDDELTLCLVKEL